MATQKTQTQHVHLDSYFGHLFLLNYIIRKVSEKTGGVDKTNGRMILSIRDICKLDDLEEINEPKQQDRAWPIDMEKTQSAWIKDNIETLFTSKEIPVWGLKYAFELLEQP